MPKGQTELRLKEFLDRTEGPSYARAKKGQETVHRSAVAADKADKDARWQAIGVMRGGTEGRTLEALVELRRAAKGSFAPHVARKATVKAYAFNYGHQLVDLPVATWTDVYHSDLHPRGMEKKRASIPHDDVVVQNDESVRLRLVLEWEEAEVPDVPDQHTPTLPDHTDLLLAKEFSDLTIKVGETELPAHRVVLAQSPVLKANLLSGMEEDKRGVLEIGDFDAAAVRGLLKVLYTGRAPDDVAKRPEVYLNLGEKYQVEEMKLCACRALAKGLTTENAIELAQLAATYQAEWLKERINAFARSGVSFPEAELKDLMRKAPEVAQILLSMPPTHK